MPTPAMCRPIARAGEVATTPAAAAASASGGVSARTKVLADTSTRHALSFGTGETHVELPRRTKRRRARMGADSDSAGHAGRGATVSRVPALNEPRRSECPHDRHRHNPPVSIAAFLQRIETESWAATYVEHDGNNTDVLRTCPQDITRVLELCAECHLSVESINRTGGFVSDGHDSLEVALDEEFTLGYTATAAAVGLVRAWHGIAAGTLNPADSLTRLVRHEAWAWAWQGTLGDGPPDVPPLAEVFLRLFLDAQGETSGKVTHDKWPEKVIDRCGLLMTAVLLEHQDPQPRPVTTRDAKQRSTRQ